MHASYYVNYLLEDTFWTNDDLLDALDGIISWLIIMIVVYHGVICWITFFILDISCEQVQAFIPLFLSRLYIEALLMGNLTQQVKMNTSYL